MTFVMTKIVEHQQHRLTTDEFHSVLHAVPSGLITLN